MADVEERNGLLPRNTSFQRMLELEKKYKLERLQVAHGPLPNTSSASTPPLSSQNRRPLQARRSDSLQRQQQNEQMLKAVRRSIAIPPMSITIPPGSDDQKQRKSSRNRKGKEKEEVDDPEKTPTAESAQKQVKFLGQSDNEEEEQGGSDDSSICHSPSWEEYGRKQKEKKQEAKEAKAAKKKLAARLSKTPPNLQRSSTGFAFINPERSMSDPVLTTQRGLLSPSRGVAQVVNDLADANSHLNSAFGSPVDPKDPERKRADNRGRQSEQAELVTNADQQRPATSAGTREHPRKSQSASPGPSAPTTMVKDHKTPRDACPPSASRTPLLRKELPPTPGRRSSFLQNATKMFKGRDHRNEVAASGFQGSNTSQETVHGPSESDRGRPRDGYVRHQRTQSNERALANLADDQLNESVATSHRRRRSSFTQEAKSVAMRLVGKKSDDPVKAEKCHARSQSSVDYMRFLTEPYSPPGLELMSPAGSLPTSTRQGNPPYGHQKEETDRTQESLLAQQPKKPQALRSSSEPVSRVSESSFRESARAKLTLSSRKDQSRDNAAQATSDSKDSSFKSSLAVPPYTRFRARLSSFNTKGSQTQDKMQTPEPQDFDDEKTPKTTPSKTNDVQPASSKALLHPLAANSGKTTTLKTKGNSHISEGSSSSGHDDGSPLPSPATTPDSSRPQSSGGLPPLGGGKSRNELSLNHDDQRTVRQSHGVGSTTQRPRTPRLEKNKSREGYDKTEEEQWSRTALPLEIDCDAQSFVTSLTNLDHLDSSDGFMSKESLIPPPLSSPHSSVNTRNSREGLRHDATETREPACVPLWTKFSFSNSNPSLRLAGNSSAESVAVAQASSHHAGTRGVSTPPKSAKRPQTADGPNKSTLVDSNPTDKIGVVSERNLDMREAKTLADPVQPRREPRSKAPEPTHEKKGGCQDEGLRTAKNAHQYWSSSSEDRDTNREAHRKRHHKKGKILGPETGSATPEHEVESGSTPLSPNLARHTGKSSTLASMSTPSLSSSRFMSPKGVSVPSKGFESNSYFVDFDKFESCADSTDSGSFKDRMTTAASPSLPSLGNSAPAGSSKSAWLASASKQVLSSTPTAASASTPALASTASRPTPAPVSILKQKTRETSPPASAGLPSTSSISLPLSASHPASRSQPMLSALPKHMQMQGPSARPPAAVTEHRAPPMAKMLVECCSCKHFHDMPSKVYECMARPDAMVEDRQRGVSGAITTSVKCPWCQHDMTTKCCAGYAALVYLKEKLH